MTTDKKCLRCGASLPIDSLGGHCPHCLIEVALFPPTEPNERATRRSVLPHRFGDYELLEEIGRGGMGVVYRARQLSLNRMVALKMILAGEFASPQALRRFHQEAEAAAHFQHPHIVAVHEFGECEGQVYLTMDLVDGHTLAQLVREHPLPARNAAAYLKTVTEAVHYVHLHGMMHRDLKPSNILIDAFDQPRITDFGLARSLDSAPRLSSPTAQLTLTGQALGSPAYISPEQAFGTHGDVGPTSDVYSLGTVLYHLLTGRAPFQGETVHDVLLQVKSAEPVPPRSLNPNVPLDLETICLKCLEKDPSRRYRSALVLAEELDRFLTGEPIRARPVGAIGKLWRFCRRRPAVATLAASVLLLLVVGAMGSTVAAWRISAARRAEHSQRQAAETANRTLRQSVTLLELRRAEDMFNAGDAAGGLAHLAAILRREPSNHIAGARLVSAMVDRNWALPSAPPMRHGGPLESVCFSPDGQRVLSASRDGTARLWDSVTGVAIATMQHKERVFSARFSVNGHFIVTASVNGTAQIWNGTNGSMLMSPLQHPDKVLGAEFSHDGKYIVTTCADLFARIWNARSGALQRQLKVRGTATLLARFSPDDKQIATENPVGSIRISDAQSGETLFQLEGHKLPLQALAYSADGTRLVSTSEDGTARVWDPTTGRPVAQPLVHSLPVNYAVFGPDSKLLLTTSQEGVARLWDAQTAHPTRQTMAHEGGISFGKFSPDGQMIVTTSADNSARVWDVRTGKQVCQPLLHTERVVQADFSPDGLRLVTAAYDGTVQIWDLQQRRARPTEIRHDGEVTSVAFSRDGTVLLTAALDRTVRLTDAATGKPLGGLKHKAGVLFAEFSPDGQRVLTTSLGSHARVWDWKSSQVIGTPLEHAKYIWMARFSADGQRVVTASADGTGRVWDAHTGQPITPYLKHDGEVLAADFSPDGQFVVTASEDRTARIWSARSGESVGQPLRHLDHVKWVEFSRNGGKVLTASSDNTACIWDAATGQPMVPPLQHARTVERAAFSPDGNWVMTASLDRTARIWDAKSGHAMTAPLKHDDALSCACFSSDGERLVTACWNGTVRIWDAATGCPVTEWLETGSLIRKGVCIDPRGRRVAAGGKDGLVRVWDVPKVPAPASESILAFAEAMAGIRVGERGNVEIVPRTEFDILAQKARHKTAQDFHDHVVQWFLADPSQRPGSPF